MAQFEEARKRRFENVFVCKDCKTKKRADALDVKEFKAKCRKCGSRSLRPIKKG